MSKLDEKFLSNLTAEISSALDDIEPPVPFAVKAQIFDLARDAAREAFEMGRDSQH